MRFLYRFQIFFKKNGESLIILTLFLYDLRISLRIIKGFPKKTSCPEKSLDSIWNILLKSTIFAANTNLSTLWCIENET